MRKHIYKQTTSIKRDKTMTVAVKNKKKRYTTQITQHNSMQSRSLPDSSAEVSIIRGKGTRHTREINRREGWNSMRSGGESILTLTMQSKVSVYNVSRLLKQLQSLIQMDKTGVLRWLFTAFSQSFIPPPTLPTTPCTMM